MNGAQISALIISLVGVLIWYVKYTTKQNSKRESDAYKERIKREEKHDEIQKEERLFNRNIITNELGKIHKGNLKNAELNKQSTRLIKNMNKNLEDHNGHSQKAWEKTIITLSEMCDRLNGSNSKMIEAKKRLNKDRRQKVEKVKVDRRK